MHTENLFTEEGRNKQINHWITTSDPKQIEPRHFQVYSISPRLQGHFSFPISAAFSHCFQEEVTFDELAVSWSYLIIIASDFWARRVPNDTQTHEGYVKDSSLGCVEFFFVKGETNLQFLLVRTGRKDISHVSAALGFFSYHFLFHHIFMDISLDNVHDFNLCCLGIFIH